MRALTASLLLWASAASAEPFNFQVLSDQLASSGQPSAEELEALAAEGYERVIYIAFSDQERSIPHEDRIVKGLGLTYLQIPVDWEAPRIGDFQLFAAAMQSSNQKTLLHCQANYRASAFAFLYRVIYDGLSVADAKAEMNRIWTPTERWNQFIFDVLAVHDIDPACEGCDWTPWTP